MASPAAKCLAADSRRCCSFSSPQVEHHPLLTSEVVFCLSAFSVIVAFAGLFARRIFKALESETGDRKVAYLSDLSCGFSNLRKGAEKGKGGYSTEASKPLLRQVLPDVPSDSPEWEAFVASVMKGNLLDLKAEDERIGLKKDVDDPVCVFPFTSSSSPIQRKIKQQYDQVVKSHESKNLTSLQVAEFVNCLSEVRLELKQKSETLRRKLIITKALLLKADRSSLERHRKQLNKLDLEHKRLKEDTAVYNLIQTEFKQSPAYKKVLEVGKSLSEKEAKSCEVEQTEDPDAYFSELSFEELLEQEKKDSFWKKHGKRRPSST